MKKRNLTITQRLDAATTRANAEAYHATTEKFTFCLDLLEISALRSDADEWVNLLEDRFDEIIAWQFNG